MHINFVFLLHSRLNFFYYIYYFIVTGIANRCRLRLANERCLALERWHFH